MKFLLLVLFLIILFFCFRSNKKNFLENFSNNYNWDSAYYITISRLKDRQKYMEKQFKNQDLAVKKHLGQDKYKLKENINNLIKEGYIDNTFYLNNKTKVEKNGSIACFISHCSLWKKLKNEPGEVFLILEDDCMVLPNFKNNLNNVYNDIPTDWDMIWLGHNKLKGEYINKNILVPQNNPGVGYNAQHHCYLIKKSSINKLLGILLPINSFLTKDNKIRNNFDKFNAYFVKNNLAIQDRNEFKKSEREN
tara:strand:+ start:3203 stop:3952 length:750 start_codon:yes stop_codon:yes gene_type:complete